jgi:protein-S-isoprenylcysteine O-methyltransferase Ste14
MVDVFLGVLWAGQAIGALVLARRFGPPTAAGHPHAPARRWRHLLVLVGVASFVVVERAGGRLGFVPALGWVGCSVAAGGVGLLLWARAALGAQWSSAVVVRPGQRIVRVGPYRHVRHPMYAGLLLLVAGTALAHTSRATLVVALGVALGTALKVRAEERALSRALGAAWADYARAVPGWVPRRRRR